MGLEVRVFMSGIKAQSLGDTAFTASCSLSCVRPAQFSRVPVLCFGLQLSAGSCDSCIPSSDTPKVLEDASPVFATQMDDERILVPETRPFRTLVGFCVRPHCADCSAKGSFALLLF